MPLILGYNVPNNTIWTCIDAARVSGVAPLAVFFDATRTVAPGITSYPFHELDYSWNFGDSGAGNWSYGSNTSKNAAYGPMAAHVFETPGTYTVTLTVTNRAQTQTTSVQVVVSDPDVVFSGTNTLCFSNDSDFTGAPVGAQTITTSSWATVISHATSGNRLLMKKGGTWTAAASGTITLGAVTGTIDAFGSGSNPIVQATANNITIIQGNGATIRDWRIRNLTIDANSHTGVLVAGPSNSSQMLFQNLTANGNGLHGGIQWDSAVGTSLVFSQLFLVENSIQGTNASGGNIVYGDGAQQVALLGNLFNDSSAGEHIVRLQWTVKTVVSNNSLSNPAASKATFIIHGNSRSIFPPSSQIVVSDNVMNSGSASNVGLVSVNPQNSAGNEPIQDVIIERNYMTGSTVSTGVGLEASMVTTRLNIIQLTVSGDVNGSLTQWANIVPQPSNNWNYNNTIYTPNTTSTNGSIGFNFRQDGSAGGSHVPYGPVTIKNNLFYSPNAGGTTHTIFKDTSPTTPHTLATNSNDSQVKNTDPKFTNATPTTPADFGLQASSYGYHTGTDVPVYYDFFRTAFPSGGYNYGAIQT